jgi:hypothetical protein
MTECDKSMESEFEYTTYETHWKNNENYYISENYTLVTLSAYGTKYFVLIGESDKEFVCSYNFLVLHEEFIKLLIEKQTTLRQLIDLMPLKYTNLCYYQRCDQSHSSAMLLPNKKIQIYSSKSNELFIGHRWKYLTFTEFLKLLEILITIYL